jgi:hypothetical protein
MKLFKCAIFCTHSEPVLFLMRAIPGRYRKAQALSGIDEKAQAFVK